MTASIFAIILVLVKIGYMILNNALKLKAEDWARYVARVKSIADILQNTLNNEVEISNEDDYIKNLEWEIALRYNRYKDIILDVLERGYGLLALQSDEMIGGEVIKFHSKIAKTMNMNITNEQKTILIARILINGN